MFPVINLGPLSLPTPQLVLLLGLWLGSSVAEKQAKKLNGDPELLSRIIWGAIIAGVLGGRLSFIARNVAAFSGQWKSVLSLNPALLDPIGGLIIAAAIGYFLASRFDYANLDLLDQLVPLAAILAPAISLANFAAGKGFGTLTSLPWGVELWGGQRHPVQLYYLAASLVVFFWLVIKKGKENLPSGSRMVLFILYTSGYITFFSSFQEPGSNVIAGFRIPQLSAWIILVLAIITYYKRYQTEVNHASQ